MKKQIMILGGYGGVGKSLSRHLLKFTDVDVTIAGHHKGKADYFAGILKAEYPNRQISSCYADAALKESMVHVFKKADLVIVTTTTPHHIVNIMDAAIETQTDMIDIFVRFDVVDQLEKYRPEIIANKMVVITQAGFHPGLPGPLIRYAKNKFDQYMTANVAMVMNSLFEKPESTHEIIYEIGENKTKILKDGKWEKASYKDAIKIRFSEKFGTRMCFPLHLRELYSLQKELGLSDMGVYSAGFNPFVDNFVFPLIMLLQRIKKGLGTKFCGELMYWGVKIFYNNKPGIELHLYTKGITDGKENKYTLKIYSSDSFDFTAIAVTACLKQYLDGSIHIPDLYLMGDVADEKKVIEDFRQMGLQVDEKYA